MTFRSPRLHQPQWLSGAAHAAIIWIAAQADTPGIWPWALIAMAGVSFFAWAGNYRRYRRIHDLPTSRVASAAQGYVELVGRSGLVPGEPILSPLRGRSCCWYSYEVAERNSDNDWRTVDTGVSLAHFLLVDPSGECVISPDGAEVLTAERDTWEEHGRRCTEHLLLPGSALYAIGEFSTTTAAPTARDEHAETGALLAAWKDDGPELLRRFDLDRDGRIDLKEWELARAQARREVRRAAAAQAARPTQGVHLLRKPRDGRLFLIANALPDELGSRYRLWSVLHLAVFVAAGSAGLILL